MFLYLLGHGFFNEFLMLICVHPCPLGKVGKSPLCFSPLFMQFTPNRD
jgi:hypothetical protein